ncbi:SCO family protein [Pontibacter flavimaris]|uniref:SCO family protein n=1 Tax=Pontibacter flavimaris TaxID=1797110 RepID=UPI001F37E653|nr:SCO family protein [Pontibacter flavimaris]
MPILIFIFISVFGTHHFSLKTYYPKRDDGGRVVYDAAGDTIFQQVPYFKLHTLTGDSLSQEDLDESIYVAGFFRLPCADSCQKVFSQLVRVQEAFANNPQLKLVSFAVNAASDTTMSLQSITREYKVQEDKWYLLAADEALVGSLTKGFHEPAEQQGEAPMTGGRLLLIDKEKKVRGVYEGTAPEDVDRLILEINVLLDEYSKRK